MERFFFFFFFDFFFFFFFSERFALDNPEILVHEIRAPFRN